MTVSIFTGNRMSAMTATLGYFLVGFVLHWIGSYMLPLDHKRETWQFELLTITLWPISVICSLVSGK